jgi:hypothetical protein
MSNCRKIEYAADTSKISAVKFVVAGRLQSQSATLQTKVLKMTEQRLLTGVVSAMP